MRKHRKMLSQGQTSAQTTVRTTPLSGSTMAESLPEILKCHAPPLYESGESMQAGKGLAGIIGYKLHFADEQGRGKQKGGNFARPKGEPS
jgi:hypothetical protein